MKTPVSEVKPPFASRAIILGPEANSTDPPTTEIERRDGVVLPIFVFVAALALYLSTLSQHFSEGEDSPVYVVQVTRPGEPSDLFHPNHLAFHWFNRLVFRLFLAFGYSGNAALPMKTVSAVAGAAALCVMLKIMRRLEVDHRLALVWVAVTAFTFGFWSYSTQAETYTLPLPFLLLAVLALIGLGDGPFWRGNSRISGSGTR